MTQLGVTLVLSGCVQYKTIVPPGVDVPSRTRLPSIVTVTTRDSVHRRLEDAEFRHDTLVGYPVREDTSLFVRIPASDIAHLEGRVSTIESNVAGGLMTISLVTVLLGVLLAVAYNPST